MRGILNALWGGCAFFYFALKGLWVLLKGLILPLLGILGAV